MANTTWTPELTAAMKIFKARLTRAQNTHNWKAVIKVANDVRFYFAERDMPLPDTIILWDNAREAAEFELRLEAWGFDRGGSS